MKNRKLIALLCALVCVMSLVLCACGTKQEETATSEEYITVTPTPAPAETSAPAEETEMTTVANKASLHDGLMLIELPDASEDVWYEVQNDDACITLSDGANAIVMNHYKAGNEPSAATADGTHAFVYQTSFAQGDMVVVLTGYIQTEEDYSMVRQMMDSVDIDWEKLAATEAETTEEHTTDANVYTMKDTSYTAYVSCNTLNVREEGSTDAVLLTTLKFGTQVSVTAIVQKNGKDTDWVKITAGDVTGYVCSQYLSLTLPTATAVPTATPAPTAVTVLRYMYVANVPNSCYLWSNDKGQNAITTIPVGTSVAVIDMSNSSFYKVQYNNKTGWVNTAYLSNNAPSATAAPTATPYIEPEYEYVDVDPNAPDVVYASSYDDYGYVEETVTLYLTEYGTYIDREGRYYTAIDGYDYFLRDDGFDFFRDY